MGAPVWTVRDGKVARIEFYWNRAEGLAAAGLGQTRFVVKGVPGKSLRLAEVARAAVRSRALAKTSGPGLSACGFFYPDSVTWAFGVQGVVVEVDVEACSLTLLRHVAMHDCGRPINPMIVEGQLHGGLDGFCT